jgi:hypothetical protein
MEPNTTVGVVTYGEAIIGQRNPRTAASLLPEFEYNLPKKKLSVSEFAKEFSKFFLDQWTTNMPKEHKGPGMTFVIGGYNTEEPYGRVYLVDIPNSPTPIEHHGGTGEFGITYGGQNEIVELLLKGYHPLMFETIKKTLTLTPIQEEQLKKIFENFKIGIPLNALALQDCVDLAISLIRTTMKVQGFAMGVRGVGGDIDVAVITRNRDINFIQKKQIYGETK